MNKPEMFQETPVACSNGSEASGEKHPFFEWLEESRELDSHFSDEKSFAFDPAFK